MMQNEYSLKPKAFVWTLFLPCHLYGDPNVGPIVYLCCRLCPSYIHICTAFCYPVITMEQIEAGISNRKHYASTICHSFTDGAACDARRPVVRGWRFGKGGGRPQSGNNKRPVFWRLGLPRLLHKNGAQRS